MRSRQLDARQRSGRNPVLLLWVFVAAAAMVLAGCGNLSLNGVLSNESPGEFRLSPETVNLPVGTEFTFSATGGFTPYNYQVVSGLGTVAKDQTWVYQAPDEITGDCIEVLIKATDQLGNSDTATVLVFNKFNVVGSTTRIFQFGVSVPPITIQVVGGVPPYSWAVDGTADPAGTNPYVYTPTDSTVKSIHVIGITDAIGNYVEVTIIVLPEFNAPLTIFPPSAGVQLGGTVSFAAYGGTPDYRWNAVMNPVSPAIGTPVTYHANTVGTDMVTLTDSLDALDTATVTVTSGTILPLVLSPEGPTVMAVGDQVQFSATGGVPPYKFSSAPAQNGSIDSATGLYTQLTAGKDVKVTVTDSAGSKDHTFVRWASP